MNIQVERLENHKAQITVVVGSERWEAALKKTAKELSQRYRIPGFRQGKAPYNVVKRHLGEAIIVEDTIEKLGAEIYPEALEQAEVNPYAAG
ncbi:MAG: trigger factor family protein, partial [Anaerolineae bacterium]|nr:trigger factor family protein [Anaerolineae bacterium]